MIYLLKTIVYTAVLYISYLLLLRDRATYRWSRIFLLLCALLPLLLPLIYIPGLSATGGLGKAIQEFALPEVNIFARPGGGSTSTTQARWLAVAYAAIATLLAVRTLWQYLSVQSMLRRGEMTRKEGKVRVFTRCGYGPGSFGNDIFFPGTEVDDHILQHELAHVRLGHSRDLLVLKLLQCLAWPNILLQLIVKELKLVHEFEADAGNTDRDTYISTMLNTAFGTKSFSLSHTFFHHPIKRRIIMLQRPRPNRASRRATIARSGAFALLLTAGIIYLQSCSRKPAEVNEETAVMKQMEKVQPTSISQKNDGKAYNYVEKMPESTVDIPTFLGSHIKYPDAARKSGIEGRVIVRFIVDEEGNVTAPEAMRSPDAQLTAEAIRVIQLMPKWKPGMQGGKAVPVYFTLPIAFRLN